MIFVSIQPFAVKKMFALGATLLCLSTASCFADAMFLSIDQPARTKRTLVSIPSVDRSEAALLRRASHRDASVLDQRVQAPGATTLRLA